GAAEETALFVRAVRMAQRGNKNDVGVFRIDDDGTDVARVFQSEVLPCLASVHRLVHAVAIADVAANAGLARTHIDDVVIGRGNGDAADRSDRLTVEQRLPAHARVGGLPYST